MNEKDFLFSSSNSNWVSETDLLSSYPNQFSSVLRLHILYLFDFMLYQAQSTIGLPMYQILNMSESINKIERKITGYKSRTFIYFICIFSLFIGYANLVYTDGFDVYLTGSSHLDRASNVKYLLLLYFQLWPSFTIWDTFKVL